MTDGQSAMAMQSSGEGNGEQQANPRPLDREKDPFVRRRQRHRPALWIICTSIVAMMMLQSATSEEDLDNGAGSEGRQRETDAK